MNRLLVTSLACGAVLLSSCASNAKRYTPVTTATPDSTVVSAAPSKAPVSLESEAAKFSYVVGLDVGESIGQFEFGLDQEALYQGLMDMLSKDSSRVRLTKEERQATMEKLIAKIKADREAKDSIAAAEGLVKNQAFLEKNKKEAGVITTASGIQYIVLKEGTGNSPTAADEVTAHYVGTLVDGSKFDSSVDRGEPATFPLAHVIKGWQEMLPLMKVGQKVKCWIPPELGYGAQGNQAIPANSILVFEIELLGITPPAVEAPVTETPVELAPATPAPEAAPAKDAAPAKEKGKAKAKK